MAQAHRAQKLRETSAEQQLRRQAEAEAYEEARRPPMQGQQETEVGRELSRQLQAGQPEAARPHARELRKDARQKGTLNRSFSDRFRRLLPNGLNLRPLLKHWGGGLHRILGRRLRRWPWRSVFGHSAAAEDGRWIGAS